MNQETNKCDFCGEIKPVLRQYLHAKNKEHIDTNKHTPFTITSYCEQCGIKEKVFDDLLDEMRADKSEGSLYYAWQANIAMAMYDELDGKITKEEANRGAKRFLEILLIKSNPHPINKTQQLLKEREEEFDKAIKTDDDSICFFPYGGDSYDFDADNCKKFQRETLSLLLTSLKEEVKIMEQSLPNSKCRNAESEMFGRCFDCEKTKGYNSALYDISTLISETISNIQTK